MLIGVGVVAIGYLKLKVWGKLMANARAKREAEIED